MALCFGSVQKAYEVFNELKKIIPLTIPAWPDDMSTWEREDKENPVEKMVYGWDRKSDDGWENIFFFVKNPTDELKQKFEELKNRVPNSSMSKPYEHNKELWIFGWF